MIDNVNTAAKCDCISTVSFSKTLNRCPALILAPNSHSFWRTKRSVKVKREALKPEQKVTYGQSPTGLKLVLRVVKSQRADMMRTV